MGSNKKIHYLQEVQTSSVKYEKTQRFLNNNIELNNDLTKEESSWNIILREVITIENSQLEQVIKSHIDKIEQNNLKEINIEYLDFLNEVLNTYNKYKLEKKDKKKNKFQEVSINSCLQLIRFIPEFPKKNLDIYVDERTGYFGVVIKANNKGKPLLNLLMQDNNEIIYSYIKRRKKIIKISGKAYFNDEYEDSCEMKKLIRMIDE